MKGLENKTFNPLCLRTSALSLVPIRLHCSVYCHNLKEKNVCQFLGLANSCFAVNASLIVTASVKNICDSLIESFYTQAVLN